MAVIDWQPNPALKQRPLPLEISVELWDLRVQIAGVSQPLMAVVELRIVGCVASTLHGQANNRT
jgi:hypothetical protein